MDEEVPELDKSPVCERILKVNELLIETFEEK